MSPRRPPPVTREPFAPARNSISTRWDAGCGATLPEITGTPRVTQFSGGASNWTYGLAYPDHDLVLRRPPAGTKAKSAHDMGRESFIQRALRPVYPLVPEVLAFCDDPAVLGDEFYLMRRVPGIVLHRRPAEGYPDRCADGSPALPQRGRRAGGAPRHRPRRHRSGDDRQRRRLRQTPDRRLVRPLSQGPHVECPELPEGAPVADRTTRPTMSPPASSTATSGSTIWCSTRTIPPRSAPSSTGRWPPSATR